MDLPVYCRLEKIKGNRDYHIQMEVITMNYSTSYSTVYIGIDAHKDSFSLVSYRAGLNTIGTVAIYRLRRTTRVMARYVFTVLSKKGVISS